MGLLNFSGEKDFGLLLNGIGLLASKRRSQADRYIGGIQGNIQSRQQRDFKKGLLDEQRAYDKPQRDAALAYTQAQTKNLSTPGPVDNSPFSGNGMNQQIGNILSTLGPKIQAGETLTPQQISSYNYAFQMASRPNIFTTADGRTMEQPAIDLSAFPLPSGFAKTTPLSETAPSSEIKIISEPTPTAVKEIDKKYAPEYLEWTQNGFSDAQKAIGSLSEALNDLETGKTTTGGIAAMADSILPDSAIGFLAPDYKNTKDSIEEQVQRNLKLILGAQFTEKEGNKLIARAYNPSLGNEHNIPRLKALIEQIRSAAQAKQEQALYFDKHKTLNGFEGRVYTMADFDPETLFNNKGGDNELQSLKDELGL